MEIPFFYISGYVPGTTEVTLDEDNSRHAVQVLRMQAGERLRLTDGRGLVLSASIGDPHKKKCRVRVDGSEAVAARAHPVTIAISLVKNASRFEWFLEKATEMGVSRVIPLLCERTERQHFRYDRMQQIVVSAMLQSQQCWLPELSEPLGMESLIEGAGVAAMGKPGEGEGAGAGGGLEEEGGVKYDRAFIAHCEEDRKLSLAAMMRGKAPGGVQEQEGVGRSGSSIILIGPEGDFTANEIALATGRGFVPVMLGETRLRTETAGVVAAALLCVE